MRVQPSFDLFDVWWEADVVQPGPGLIFLSLNGVINLFVPSDNSVLGTLCSSHSPLQYVPLFSTPYISLVYCPSGSLHHPSSSSSPLPAPLVSLSGLSPYSLIAHNLSQAVSLTNSLIRVGSRPYGRQADSAMVSSICLRPSTCSRLIV